MIAEAIMNEMEMSTSRLLGACMPEHLVPRLKPLGCR